MRTKAVSRRTVVQLGSCVLAGWVTASRMAEAHALAELSPKNDETIRKWYAAWEQRDWRPLDALLTEDFRFSSAAGDDHITKRAFKSQCWQTQKDFIHHFDLQRVFGSGDEAMVLYTCHTTNGKTFRNVEYLRLKDAKVASIDCYFGAQASFPSAVSAKQG